MTGHDSAGLVVVGSGPAGVSAAMAYREAGGRGPVKILSADTDPPYQRPPLSKDFLRGRSDAADIELHAPSEYSDRHISLHLGDPVTELDPGGAVVTAAGSRHPFAHCVLATGAEPTLPPVPGVNRPGVHALRALTHAHDLRTAAETAARVIVVGSGFIGCEAAASLARLGLSVTLLATDAVPQQDRLGGWVGERIADWLSGDHVELITGRRLAAITEDDDRLVVHTDTDATLSTDLVLIAAGVRPRIDLAHAAGLHTEQGRIRVDSMMRTSVAGILAVGDVARADNTRARRALSVEHWGDALRMGEIGGGNAAGRESRWSEVPGFWSTIGDHTLKYAAWGDGFDHLRVVEHPGGGFTVWYGQDGRSVGVLTHDADADYESGLHLVEQGAPLPI